MVTKRQKQIATTAAATFGVALTSMYTAPDMNADILELTYNGGSASAEVPFDPTSASILNPTDMDQVPNGTGQTSLGSVIELADVIQWNDAFGDGAGRTFALYVSSLIGGPQSHAIVNSGDVIDPATFVGATGNIGGGSSLDFEGSAFVAVRPRAAPGNVYWFKLELPAVGSQMSIFYTDGEYGDNGEALTVGGTTKMGCDFALGDVNQDGEVDILDVAPFVDAITGEFVCEADINEDGVVDILDVAPFVALLTGG